MILTMAMMRALSMMLMVLLLMMMMMMMMLMILFVIIIMVMVMVTMHYENGLRCSCCYSNGRMWRGAARESGCPSQLSGLYLMLLE